MASKADENGEKAAEEPASHVMVEGVQIPAKFQEGCKRPMKEHVELLKALEMRQDDVMLMAYPKSAEGGNYFQYMKEMDEFRKSNTGYPFLNMSFEDTKEDPGKTVKSLAEFLGVEVTPQLCADIVEATRFNKMKEADKSKQQPDIPGSIKMYRKGEVGDWKNYLTVAQSERIDATMAHLKSCDYNFRYTL